MRKIFAGFCLIMILTSFNSTNISSNECEVKEFYKSIESDSDTKVLTKSGNFEDVDLLLVTTRMEEGVFEVSLTRKESNLYKIEGTDYYLETRYCYEYATYEKVILKIESNYGYRKAEIIFN